MSPPFDPFHVWLDIPPEEQPPDHYRLLGVAPGEADPHAIAAAAQRRIAQVKPFAAGAHAELAQRILNQVTRAKACLLHPSRRARYDQALQAGLIAAREKAIRKTELVAAPDEKRLESSACGRRWIIGAAADCDIVVARPTVSRRHCSLTEAHDGCLLEDLGSTNGTYLNGRKVSAPVLVCSSDKIRLGRSVELPWPEAISLVPMRMIRIGAAPDNDFVLDFPTVSWHHAVLRIVDAALTIEDLSSTNGTSLGSLSNPVRKAAVSSSDVVYFGSHAVSVSQLLAAAGAASGVE